MGVGRGGGNPDGKKKKKKREGRMFLPWLSPYLSGRNSYGSPVGGMGAVQTQHTAAWSEAGRHCPGGSISPPSRPGNGSYRRRSQPGRGMGLPSSAAAFLAGRGLEVPGSLRGCQDPFTAWLQRAKQARQGMAHGPVVSKKKKKTNPKSCKLASSGSNSDI